VSSKHPLLQHAGATAAVPCAPWARRGACRHWSLSAACFMLQALLGFLRLRFAHPPWRF
jgi:hypothetical protein